MQCMFFSSSKKLIYASKGHVGALFVVEDDSLSSVICCDEKLGFSSVHSYP